MTRLSHIRRTLFPELSPALLAIVLLSAVVARVGIGSIVADDAYITFRYSENIVAGNGFTYNPPARVLGTTTPLFALVMTSAASLGLPLETSSLTVSTVADLVTILAVVSMLTLCGYRVAGLLAGAAIAVWPAYLSWAVSGLETSLYVALLTGALWAFVSRAYVVAGVIVGFAVLCRPDGLLLVPLVAAGVWFFARRSFTKAALVFTVVVVPWVLFAQWYFGSPVPSSFVAKATHEAEALASVRNFSSYFSHGPYAALSLLALVGVVPLWRTGLWGVRLWLCWWAGYAAVFVGANAFTHYPWYFVPLLPLYWASCAVGAEWIVRGLASRWAVVPAVGYRVAAGVFLALLFLWGGWRLPKHREILMEQAAGREQLYAEAAAEIAVADGVGIVAVTEIGAFGYAYPGPILDLLGLVSPEAIGVPFGDTLRGSQARWLLTYDDHVDQELVGAAWFASEFRLVWRRPVSSTRALELYERRSL